MLAGRRSAARNAMLTVRWRSRNASKPAASTFMAVSSWCEYSDEHQRPVVSLPSVPADRIQRRMVNIGEPPVRKFAQNVFQPLQAELFFPHIGGFHQACGEDRGQV